MTQRLLLRGSPLIRHHQSCLTSAAVPLNSFPYVTNFPLIRKLAFTSLNDNMNTPSSTMNLSQPSPALPSIAVRISVSSSALDLSLNTSFKITIVSTFHGTHAITFRERETPLLLGPLYKQGLTFTNTRNSAKVPRPALRCALYSSSNDGGLPTAQNKDSWITLLPEQSHVREAIIEPMLCGAPIPSMSAAEMMRIQEQQTKTLKWPWIMGFEDGQTYEIGISEGTGVNEWIKGSLEEILDIRKSNLTPSVEKEVIRFELRETTSFAVKRPDRDGSLSWP
jgi:hypothetical protein